MIFEVELFVWLFNRKKYVFLKIFIYWWLELKYVGDVESGVYVCEICFILFLIGWLLYNVCYFGLVYFIGWF